MASGSSRNCQLLSISKVHEKHEAALSELHKFGGKFKIHNKALHSFALSSHVELEGNTTVTFGFLYLESHKGK